MKNFLALFFARNREFYRDKGSLGWSILFPLILIFGLSFALSNDKTVYKVGVLGDMASARILLKDLPWLDIVAYDNEALALRRLTRHQLDMVISTSPAAHYWINTRSKKAFFLEKALLSVAPGKLTAASVSGQEVGYVAWVVPGILCMSLMFSCLYGVGYVIVRYRDSGVLKRFMATPVTALQFLGAQAASRLLVSISTLVVVFVGSHWLLHFPVEGSWLLLLLVAILGALSMIALSLLCAARINSLEFMNGLLNLLSWPMMMLSGLWFSLDAAPAFIRGLSQLMPLTHLVNPARAIMIDGAGFTDVLNDLVILLIMTVVLMTLAARSFRWQKD
ncbi:MAG: ABC transporter permease [bacterium]|nr:ABC transporter permease [bacterium]